MTERVVVRLPNWLGDIVMALPALGALRTGFPRAHLAAAAPAPLVPLLAAVPGVDEAIPLSTGSGWSRVRADADQLAAGRFDLAVLFTNSFGTALSAWRAAVPERWGYRADARGWLLTRGVSRRAARAGAGRHHSEYYTTLVERLGIEAPASPARLAIPAAWRDRAARLLADHRIPSSSTLVGVAPGAAYGGAKRYPPRLVAEVLRQIAATTPAAVLLLGAPADRETGHAIESELRRTGEDATLGGRLVNLVGRTDLPALCGVIANCRAFLSNDSGAMHLAAAAGVHVTAVFGPTDERATHPLGPHTIVREPVFCRPCLLRECPIDHRCMTRILPATVHASLAPHLTGAAR
jgi:heptosyltransferase-2